MASTPNSKPSADLPNPSCYRTLTTYSTCGCTYLSSRPPCTQARGPHYHPLLDVHHISFATLCKPCALLQVALQRENAALKWTAWLKKLDLGREEHRVLEERVLQAWKEDAKEVEIRVGEVMGRGDGVEGWEFVSGRGMEGVV